MASLTLNKIKQDLLRFDDHDIDDEFLGIAVILNEHGSAKHSGLVLCYEGEKLLFHFTGRVLLENVTGDVTEIYYKKLELFPHSYLSYIRAYFDILLTTVDPLYGFVFTDSFYNDSGKYVSDIEDFPDFCTCVGFCINVIRGLFLKHTTRYIETDDWNNESLEKVKEIFIQHVDTYLELISKYKPEKIAEIKSATYKRIYPIELLLSGFFAKPKKLPVRKVDITPRITETRAVLKEKWLENVD